MTLVEFLRYRLAEEEEWARAASGPEWHSRYEDQPDCHMYGDYGFYVRGPAGTPEFEDSEQGKHDADFIARHDPARVLADVKAKRAIVDRHSEVCYGAHEGVGSVTMCRECRDQRGPCWTLRNLASVYADHPDYDATWTP
jgi:hypothetical protein